MPTDPENAGCPVMGAPSFKSVSGGRAQCLFEPLEFADTHTVNGKKKWRCWWMKTNCLERDKGN